MNKFIFITSSNIRKIYSNLDISVRPVDDLKSFTFIVVATSISVIAYIFGGIVEISIGDRSLSDLWGQFEIWHALSMIVSLFIATSDGINNRLNNGLKEIHSNKWFKGVLILIPTPLFMWISSEFWIHEISTLELFSWAVVVAFVSIFYFFTSGLKGINNFLTEAIDSDAGIATKIIKHCKHNNQKIIYAGGGSFGDVLNLLENAAVKEEDLTMVFDINTISNEAGLIEKSEFAFENKCKVETILHEIYNKGLMKTFRDLDSFAKEIDPKNKSEGANKIEAHHIHKSNYINDIKVPISTPEYLRNKCLSKHKNDLHSASLIYAFFFNSSSGLDNEISFCTKKEIEIFNKKIIKKIQEADSFDYSGVLSGLWDITSNLKNDKKLISNKSIKALCSLQELEIFWPIVYYTFEDSLFLSKLSKSMTVTNLDLSFNEIIGIYNILFTLGEYSQAQSILESTAISYDFSWECKSLSIKVQQRIIDQNFKNQLLKIKEKYKPFKELDKKKQEALLAPAYQVSDLQYFDLFSSENKRVNSPQKNHHSYLDFINNLAWIGTRIQKDEQLFSKITLQINQLLDNVEKILSRSAINNIPPNEIWHFHNNSANFYQRLLEFNSGNQDYLKKAINHHYKSINVKSIDIKWLSGSLINYATFVKDNNNMITSAGITFMDGYSCSDKDVMELAELSKKYKSQIYDLDEIIYPRTFLE